MIPTRMPNLSPASNSQPATRDDASSASQNDNDFSSKRIKGLSPKRRVPLGAILRQTLRLLTLVTDRSIGSEVTVMLIAVARPVNKKAERK